MNNLDQINGEISDGPLFRATLADLEKRTTILKHNLKTLLKTGEAYLTQARQYNETEQDFFDALSSQHSLITITEHFSQVKALLGASQENYANICQNLLIDPLRRIYESDVKLAESRKRDFEDASRDYYSSLARYLGIKADEAQKKKLEQDLKYQAKKREFDLQCFDYINFLKELHTGQKDQEISFILGNFAEKQYKMYKRIHEDMERFQVNAIGQYIRDLTKSSHQHKKEKEEKRKVLEGRITTGNATSLDATGAPAVSPFGVHAAADALDGPAPLLQVRKLQTSHPSPSPLSNQPSVISSEANTPLSVHNTSSAAPHELPLPPISAAQQYTTQLSHADSGGTSETAIGQAQLHFVHNPEQSSASFSHMLSRNMSGGDYGASVGDGTDAYYLQAAQNMSASKRKEGVLLLGQLSTGPNSIKSSVTPTGWKKIWVVVDGGKLQEYSNWKKAPISLESIDLQFTTVREARNCDRRFCFEVISPHVGKRIYQATDEADFRSWLVILRNAIEESLTTKPSSGNAMSRPLDESERQLGAETELQFFSQNRLSHTLLLAKLRSQDIGNFACADCNTRTPPPDWCSINLGLVLCIECSGIHRSLGTHVSKVRSLTLDVYSFTPELVALMLNLGNTSVNMILEANLNAELAPFSFDNDTSKSKSAKQRLFHRSSSGGHSFSSHILGTHQPSTSTSSDSSASVNVVSPSSRLPFRLHRRQDSNASSSGNEDNAGGGINKLSSGSGNYGDVDWSKPVPSHSREVKTAFIHQKYVDKRFVDPAFLVASSPDEPNDVLSYLVRGIDIQSPISVLHALLLLETPSLITSQILLGAFEYRRDLYLKQRPQMCQMAQSLAASWRESRDSSLQASSVSIVNNSGSSGVAGGAPRSSSPVLFVQPASDDTERSSSPLGPLLSQGFHRSISSRIVVTELLFQNGADLLMRDARQFSTESEGEPNSLWIASVPSLLPFYTAQTRDISFSENVARFHALWSDSTPIGGTVVLDWTLLHYAAFFADIEAVVQLVTKGAALSALDSAGHTPHHILTVSFNYFSNSNKLEPIPLVSTTIPESTLLTYQIISNMLLTSSNQ